MSKDDYSNLLKNPKWQKKRLEVLEAMGFKCENCGKDDQELQVHHRIYSANLKPWEHDIKTMAVWCENCHKSYHQNKDYILKNLSYASPRGLYVLGLFLQECHRIGINPGMMLDGIAKSLIGVPDGENKG